MCCERLPNDQEGERTMKGRIMNRRCGGFSFIEVMVVVVIIGLLAGAVAIKVTGYMDDARTNRAMSDIATIVKQIDAYKIKHDRYPSVQEGLSVLELKNGLDPWGNEYLYNTPGPDDEPYEVYTLGADAREGGEESNADIYSWQLGQAEE